MPLPSNILMVSSAPDLTTVMVVDFKLTHIHIRFIHYIKWCKFLVLFWSTGVYSAQLNSSGNRANNLSRNAHSSASVNSFLGHSTWTSGPLTSGPLTSGSLTSKTLNPGPSGDVQRGSTVLQPLTVSKTEFLSPETKPIHASGIVSSSRMSLDYEKGRNLSSGKLKGSIVMEGGRHLMPIEGKK